MSEPPGADAIADPAHDLSDTALVVVNYGSAALVRANISPISLAHPRLRVVLIDNFSTVAERCAVSALTSSHGWTPVLRDDNGGFGLAANAGVDRAARDGARRVVLLNPDATIGPAGLRRLVAATRQDPLALVAPRVERPDGTPWFVGADLYLADGRLRSIRRRGPDWTPDPAVSTPWLSGACLASSVELWRLVGGFDPRFFLYWEDVDLSWRVCRAGGRLVVDDAAVAVHDEGGTQRPAVVGERSARHHGKSTAYYYFNVRNRALFAALHLTAADVRRWRRHDLAVAWEVLLQGGRRQLLHSPAPLLAAARGLVAGRLTSRRVLRNRLRAG